MSQSGVMEGTNSFNGNSSFNNNSFNNIDSFNTTISFNHTDERAKILAWLSPLDPWIRHHDIRTQRVENVGDWLLRTEEYRNWLDGVRCGKFGNSALFCYGGPGVGKSYIR